MKDVIIGTITDYDIIRIAPWVMSLEQSGFSGDKYMVCYNASYEVVDFLKSRGFTVFTFIDNPPQRMYTYDPKPNFHVCVDRFYDMWVFLNGLSDELKNQYRYIISTDVGDVVFQSNPSTWLEQNLGNTNYKINAATESIKYKDEVMWGAQNMRESFGQAAYEHIADRLIYNAGTISGDFKTIHDMFMVIYQMCQGYKTRNPDQAAYNFLLSLEPYKSLTRFNMANDGWACQIGTSYDPGALKYFGQSLVEPSPLVDKNNGVMTTTSGKPHVIVHQYTRVNNLLHMMYSKYLGAHVN